MRVKSWLRGCGLAITVAATGWGDPAGAQNSGVSIAKVLCTSAPANLTTLPGCSSAPAVVAPNQQVFYAVTLDNTAGTAAQIATLQEQYAAGFTFAGVTCTVTAGINLGFAITPTVPAAGTPIGPLTLLNGQKVVCVIAGAFSNPGATALQNIATVVTSAGSNSASQIASIAPAPAITVQKTQITAQPANGMPWNSLVKYAVQIKNTSNATITGLALDDFFQELPGTPLFRVLNVSHSNCCNFNSSTFSGHGTGVQNLQGYDDRKQVWTGTLTLAPLQTASMTLDVRFISAGCDSHNLSASNSARNVFRVSYTATVMVNGTPTPVNYVVEGQRDTAMAPTIPCKSEVVKTVTTAPNKIVFGLPLDYNVTYRNVDNYARVVGTLFDAVRIVQPNYATQLPLRYTYRCTAPAGAVTGFVANNSNWNAGWTGFNVAAAVYAGQPHQGLRIIDNPNPVTFGPGKTLTCRVRIVVDRPPPGDPFCLSSVVPQLENLALMDVSRTYQGSLPWPPSAAAPPATNWSAVSSPLARCFNLLVTKSVTPTTTLTTGGPLTYTLSVQNLGDQLNGGPGSGTSPWDGPVVYDVFTAPSAPNAAFVSAVPACGPNDPTCAWLPGPGAPNPFNPIGIGIKSLAPNATITTTFSVSGPFQPPAIINDAMSLVPARSVIDWYSYNSSTCNGITVPGAPGTCAHLEVPVTQTNTLIVRKTLWYSPGFFPPSMDFPVLVACTNGGPNQVLHFTTSGPAPSNPPPQQLAISVPNSACHITEQTPIPPGPYGNCWHWAPTTYPLGQDAIFSTSNPPTQTIEVHNALAC